ncbi:tRNA lysidine(34) synthetase TilS [Pelagibacterium luteolum]|uniref:tRNA(Ile)-lysidine synthase n=1 Tax=Pelagibacterium luteolum TaxID=440168 RepID=A0A1G7ZD03_9HYPH|nr:tRNA lysidine(34) synthetase TilS [Pelagibacterium luteolum]SDH06622.1 tRNA(Ile)-lysidine synthase [Pelagibacterium luteolum]
MLTDPGDPLSGLDPARLFASIADEKTIGLAVSGGADSLALMLLVAGWAERPRAIVYTLDHALRPEAAAEAAMVVSLADQLGLEARCLRWTGEKPSSGKQEAARTARYRLLGEAMTADGATVLLTAHHQRDQAETVLMRLAHGSGISGLGSMTVRAEVMGVSIVRPLLEVAPETLAAIVARAGLMPANDPSNADPTYERTRWRQALPGLAALGLTDARLAQFASRLRRMDALADSATDGFLSQHARIDRLGVVHLSRTPFADAQPELAIRALTRAIETVSGQPCAALGQVERLYDALLSDRATPETLSGAVVHPRDDGLLVYREIGRMPVLQQALIAGREIIFDNRFTIMSARPGLMVSPGQGWTRERFKAWAGDALDVPVAALAACPIVTAEDGRVVAIGAWVKGDDIAIHVRPLTDRR